MKKLVIIGGGFTGAYCAKKLQNKFRVTLIDNKPYFEFTPGILRTIVKPSHLKKIQVPHKHYLKNAITIKNEVILVTPKYVKLKNQKKINYDYLIIASGTKYSVPIKEKNLISTARAEELNKYHEKLSKSKKVLIIGGGLVGVELAAEIITTYPEKNVSIVNSGERLISRNHSKAIQKADKFLQKNNVEIINNERIIKNQKNIYLTDKKRKIKTDIAFICTGITPNYEFMKKQFKNLINPKGYLITNEYLQLQNHQNIFVGGDVTHIKEEKTAQTAERHAKTIIKNIINLEKNKPMKNYTNKRRPMIISLGPKHAIYDDGKLVLSGKTLSMLKNFVEWKTMYRYKKTMC